MTISNANKKAGKQNWTKPVVKDAGTVAEILKGGGGKMSIETNDTGDIRKPKGQG